ncbi:MAG: hypothetical protein H0W61_04580 [Bacteroidetes bacterium]|nr:hypothetical protein [Bacteroidota bacterium]
MKKNKVTALLGICVMVAANTYAQDGAKAKHLETTRLNQTTVVTTEKKEPAFTSEKIIDGKTIQVFTQEQFDKLPAARKDHYLSNAGSYEILNKRDN